MIGKEAALEEACEHAAFLTFTVLGELANSLGLEDYLELPDLRMHQG